MEICRSDPFRPRALKALQPFHWFFRPGLVTVRPYASLALLTPPTSFRQPPAYAAVTGTR